MSSKQFDELQAEMASAEALLMKEYTDGDIVAIHATKVPGLFTYIVGRIAGSVNIMTGKIIGNIIY